MVGSYRKILHVSEISYGKSPFSPKIKKKSPELINKLLKNLTKIKYKKNCKFCMFSWELAPKKNLKKNLQICL